MGAQKSTVLTKKAWVENSETGERSIFGAKKSAEKGKKAEKLRFFRLIHAFFGEKKHGKGDQGRFTKFLAYLKRVSLLNPGVRTNFVAFPLERTTAKGPEVRFDLGGPTGV